MTRKCKYNWKQIQEYYDDGNSWRDVNKKFGCSMAALSKASKRGDLESRNKSESVSLERRKNPKFHSEETKKKISTARKKYLEENPDKVPYLLNHYSIKNSYPEEYFLDLFKKEGIDLKHHLQVGLYQLDFYNKDKMIDVEIDGEQHHLDERIVESDVRRNNYLASLGWRVYRIRWSDYQKKTRKEKEEVIKEIKKLVL